MAASDEKEQSDRRLHNSINRDNGIQNMSPKITIKPDYILVEPKKGTDFIEIRRGIGRLYYVKGIPKKNRIWLFREGPQNLSSDDLHRLKDIIKENYPGDSGVNKTALVVEPGAQSGMAEAFAEIVKDLPHVFKVFSTLAAAEEWVRQP